MEASQVWMWYNLESPFHASLDGKFESQLDWTATYRRDSTIVAPYAKVLIFSLGMLLLKLLGWTWKLKAVLLSVESLHRNSKKRGNCVQP